MPATSHRKVALVTGANKGIGFHVARQLAQAELTVLMACRDRGRGDAAAHELKASGHDVDVVHLDVTDDESIRLAVRRITDEHGRLDVLVNNAGITSGLEPASRVSRSDLRTTFETNVFGLVAVTNALLPLLRASAPAHVVNVSSELGSPRLASDPQGPFAGLNNAAYQASKSALNLLTVLYAKELGDAVAVTAVGPGYRATELNGGLPTPGAGDPADGARAVVRVALDDHAPSGVFLDDQGRVVPW